MKVPVYLFTGFLESGKTTFIKEILKDEEFVTNENSLLILFEEVVEEFKIIDVELVTGEYEDTIDENNLKLIVESEEDKKLIKNLINEK